MRFLVDAWRWILHCFTVPKDHDNDDRAERHDSELAIAICGLTCELAAHREIKFAELELLRSNVATKHDVRDAKREILNAIADLKLDPQARALAAQLKASADPLIKAVAENQLPISG